MPSISYFSEAVDAVERDRPFLVSLDNAAISYGDLHSITTRFAAIFNALGVGGDEPVAILLPQGPQSIMAILATMSAAVAAPLNPALGIPEILFLLQRMRARVLIANAALDPALLSSVRAEGVLVLLLSGFPEWRLVANTELAAWTARLADSSPVSARGLATGLLLPTSGTCGEPKLVKLSQEQLLHSATHIASVLKLTHSDRNFCVLPCFHIHGLSTVLATVVTGGVVVSDGAFSIDGFERVIATMQVSWLSATPTHFQAILKSRQRKGSTLASTTLRFLRSASAPISDTLALELERAFDVPLIQAYGMTEAGPQIACNGLAVEKRRIGSVGRPAGTEVDIRSEEGLSLPAGQIGEIVIRGDNVIAAYFEGLRADSTPFCAGWFHTGDLGFMDEDGFLYVTGRIREMINCGGEKLAPRQIESVLLAHPAVQDVVVFAAPHATLGEIPHAAVVLKEGFLYADSDDATSIELQHVLRRYCLAQMASFKVPHIIHIVPKIPIGDGGAIRNGALLNGNFQNGTIQNGKVQRGKMHALFDVSRRREHDASTGASPDRLLENTVATAWADILGSGPYSGEDHFFLLGGDSLAAARVVSILERELGVHLPANCFFQFPTVAEQVRWLSRELDHQATLEALPPDMPARHGLEQLVPLSAGQHRLWFLHQAGSGNQYNMSVSLWLRGELDTTALSRVINVLRQRHSVLRTTINVLDGSPVQRIRPHTETELSGVDISDLPREWRNTKALALAGEFRNRPFALDAGPLFRCHLIRLDDREHLLAIAIHHIICDGWSMEILLRELGDLYRQQAAGLTLGYLQPPVQFHEVIATAMQRARSTASQHIQWWRQQLAAIDPILNLPGGGIHGVNSVNAPAAADHLYFSVSSAMVQQLDESARGAGGTPYMLMVSALGILLHRYTRQQRFCLGTVSANRHHAALENMVGFLANTLPLPMAVASADTVGAVVARTIETIKDVFAHSDIEFEEIVQACSTVRETGVTPLFQVMLAYHNLPRQETAPLPVLSGADEYTELVMERVVVDAESAKFDLSLHLRPGNDGMQGVWQYRREKMDARTIASMNRDFSSILQAIVAAGQLAVVDIPFECESFTHSKGEDHKPPIAPDPLPVMQLFAHQALTNPLRPAISATSGRLTYAQLQDRVSRLANYLAGKQVGPGKTVAILLPRDVAMLIAPLAVLAVGATFVPLDCASPQARLWKVIAAARADLVIVNSGTRSLLTANATDEDRRQEVLCLDDSELAITNCAVFASWHSPSPDDPAYIVFTSGSTGRPKGVVISHGNVAHYIRAMSLALDMAATDKYLHTASPAFSAAVRQFVLPLVNGAEVVIADNRQMENVEALLGVVQRERVTILDLVPTLWRGCHKWLLLAGRNSNSPSGANNCPHLRLLLSASEPLPDALAASLRERWPHAQLLNMYGQTETSGIVAIHPYEVAAERSQIVALGKPISGHAIHLYDEHLHPVPAGAIGEICVTGACVGQGYLTMASPVPEPFVQRVTVGNDAALTYRTGDLGRFREDGSLEFCGRLDTQVKIRGFRIEPNAIEAVVLEHPEITEAAVLVASGAAGHPQLLLLYYVDDGSSSPSAGARLRADLYADLHAEIRAYLSQRLPSYMVPNRYVQVDSMPRTLSGKLDRGALQQQYAEKMLPESELIPLRQVATGRADRDEIAQTLQTIWQDVLLVEPIGLQDNFFDLGGNSILSIEIVSAAQDAGLHLELDQLFKFQTIAELAQDIEFQAPGHGHDLEHGHDKNASAKRLATHATLATNVNNVNSAVESAHYTADSLRAYGQEALARAGMTVEGAAIVTEVQLEASLRGQATHNIGDIPRYARRLASGVLNSAPVMQVTQTSALSATVDGDNGPGQWVATIAMTKAIELAARSGAGIVSVKRSNHFGAAGHYAWRACQMGMVGLCVTNGPVVLAPTGGITPLFGNNPLAIGLPRGNGHPVVLDISMAVATRGKIGLTVAEGKPLQAGWILDKLGLPTTQLQDLAAGLAVPIGGHKGYGLAMAIEILAGALTGAGYCSDHGRTASARHGGADIGHFFIAFDPGLFIPREQFEARVDDIVLQAKASELATGSTHIFVPGEIEFTAREENLRLGVPLHESVVRRLTAYGNRHNLVARLQLAPEETEIRYMNDAR